MPKRYAREFRRAICDRLVAGEGVGKVANESGVSVGTLHRWKHQALIDADLRLGTKSVEVDELAQARQTVEELEAELPAARAASALFNGRNPKPGLLRACGLPGRRGLTIVLLRAQVPRALRPPDPSADLDGPGR